MSGSYDDDDIFLVDKAFRDLYTGELKCVGL